MSSYRVRTAADLASRFSEVDPSFGPVPIWWWSGQRLEPERLRWQMAQLVEGGVDQAVVMCLAPRGPLYGSLADDPPFLSEPWWQLFLGACEDAHQLGFRFWLYDQYGFSGANFQGQIVARHPSWAGQELGRLVREVADQGTVRLRAPEGSSPVGGYAVASAGSPPVSVPLDPDGSLTWSQGPARVVLCYAQERGFDYFDKAACAELIDTVLGEFRRRADKWFGPVIVGLFQDELPRMPSWGRGFAESFVAAHGYDLVDQLATLWEGGVDPASATVRRDYHAHRATLAREAFFEPYGAWAAEAGLVAGFDQQSPAREGDPVSATALYGDYLDTHAVFSAPGSDHWGDPKLHSSLAHASGQPRTWIEAFHSSGWGGTLEETYDWLGPFLRRGANLYDPHAVYYSTAGGWWEWAAPSTCWRQPYWPDYPVFSAAVTRLCSLMSTGELVADTILLFPTTSVQSDLSVEPAPDDGRLTSDVYHLLNGSTSWFDERAGILDRAGHDYEILDERQLLEGEVVDGTWRVAGGTFRNLVLPSVTTLTTRFSVLLSRFVAGGGNLVSVGPVPDHTIGDEPGGQPPVELRGRVVDTAAEVADHLVRGPLWVEADAPHALRRCGDALVLLLVAHDEQTGTRMPVFDGNSVDDRISGDFSWQSYWKSFSDQGYDFRPLADRRAKVRVGGTAARSAQRWDPRTGDRVDLAGHVDDEGAFVLDVAFADGPMAVVVLGTDDLPAATRVEPSGEARVEDLDDTWEVHARSTLDNRWGDLGDPARREVLPLQVWRFEHASGDAEAEVDPADGWDPVHATFGPYLRVTAPCADQDGPVDWEPFEMSLSRGIRKDPLHYETLGPKGTVPEEFVRWETVRPGEWVGMATTLPLPADGERHLVVGADADRQVFVAGARVVAEGAGYWSSSPLPGQGGAVEVEVWLQRPPAGRQSSQPGTELRATFAVVTDLDRFRRPEWLVPEDLARAATTVRFRRRLHLDGVPSEATVQVGSEGPCSLLVNGTEVARQGAFEPYTEQRRPQVMPYDLSPWLRTGPNTVEVKLDDLGSGVAAWIDSRPVDEGGLGLVSDLGWSCARDEHETGLRLRREQWLDPRWACLWARPHPLPRAAWLDARPDRAGVVPVVPNAGGASRRSEWLRFRAPVGATRLRVPTELPFVARVGGEQVSPDDQGDLLLPAPLPAGTEVCLRFDARDGHRGGGLVHGPVEAWVSAVPASLASWEELGLRSLAGAVSYRQAVNVDEAAPGRRILLDLGRVRGSAEVRVNDERAATLVWSPYRADLTAWLRPGRNEIEVVVRGTLAGYLDDSSPTPAVYKGQTVQGLFGPVRLLHFES